MGQELNTQSHLIMVKFCKKLVMQDCSISSTQVQMQMLFTELEVRFS
jgi:hypothetical protein